MSFIPTIGLSAGASKQSGDRIGQTGQTVPYLVPQYQYNSGLNMSVDLLDGGTRFYRLRTAKANVEASEANEVLQEYNVALSVKQQYYAVLAAREMEAAAQAQLDQASEQLKQASAKVAAGAATKSDSLRAIIQVGNAQLSLIQARNNLNIANASLTRLVATPFVVTATPEDSSGTMELTADSTEIAALALRGPAVVQSEASYSAAKANVRSSLSLYVPTVSARFNRGGAGLDKGFGWGNENYAYSQTMSFSLNFPFFNQGAREEQIVRTRVAEDVAEAQLRDTKLAAQQQLTQYLSAFRSAEQRVQIQLALSEAPRWSDPRMAQTGQPHLARSLAHTALHVTQAMNGWLPAEPAISIDVPTFLDPSRAPEGKHVMRIQVLEIPTRPRGDAADGIDVGDGTWTAELKQRYAAEASEVVSVARADFGRHLAQEVVKWEDMVRKSGITKH